MFSKNENPVVCHFSSVNPFYESRINLFIDYISPAGIDFYLRQISNVPFPIIYYNYILYLSDLRHMKQNHIPL